MPTRRGFERASWGDNRAERSDSAWRADSPTEPLQSGSPAMNTHDRVMMALYLMAIAVGIVMTVGGQWWGMAQVILCCALFPFRFFRR